MPTNIEIKARIDSVDELLPRATALAGGGRVDIRQDDTFFHCRDGRLKLRAFDSGSGELIYYRRPDSRGPKPSFYTRSATTDPEGLRAALHLAYGSAGRVQKHRILFIVGSTRIHLDRVEGLGDFLELEVVLDDEEALASGTVEAHRIMRLLGVAEECLVDGAYVDMLRSRPAVDAPAVKSNGGAVPAAGRITSFAKGAHILHQILIQPLIRYAATARIRQAANRRTLDPSVS